jgi:hypothetical protein
MVSVMRNAMNFSRETTTPVHVVFARVLRIPGTLACPISAR